MNIKYFSRNWIECIKSVKGIVYCVLFFLFSISTIAQGDIQELKDSLKIVKNDSLKISFITRIIGYYQPRDSDSSAYYLDMYRKYAVEDKSEYANYLHGISLRLHYSGKSREAIQYLDSARMIYEELGDTPNLLGVKNNMAYVLLTIAENAEAGKLLNENYEYFLSKDKDSLIYSEKVNMVSTLNQLTGIYTYFSETEKNHELTKQAMDLAYEIGDSVRYVINKTNFATEAIVLGDTALAIKYFRENIELKRRNKFKNHYGIEEYKLGNLYAKMGELDSSRYYLKLAEQIGEEFQPDAINVNLIKIKLGLVYVSLGEFLKARAYCEDGYDYAKSTENIAFSIDACQCLIEVHEHLRDYKTALQFSNEKNSLSALLSEGDTQKKRLIIEEKVKWSKQIYADSIKTVQENNRRDFLIKTQEKDIVRKNWIAMLLLVSLIVLTTFIFIVYKLYKKSEHRKEIINDSLQQKEILLKEIHHRVKNNFQVISSLLNLQSHHIEDPKQLAPIRDAQNRIQSMALVHEKLYKNTDLSSVEMDNYFSTLIDSIKSGYTDTEENFQLTISTEDISLGIDQSIPLGLIVNEILTNSFKYGRSDDGVLRVSLSLEKTIDSYSLQMKDAGSGFGDDIDLDNLNSLGLELIEVLTDQLNGNLSINGKDGVVYQIEFPIIN